MRFFVKKKTLNKIKHLDSNNINISYVYCVVNLANRKRYVGKRTSIERKHNNPLDDMSNEYFTSSTDLCFKNHFKNNTDFYAVLILEVSEDPVEIDEKEKEILVKYNARHNERFYNLHNGEGRYDTTGVVPVINTISNQKEIISIEKFKEYKNTNYISYNKGHMTVWNKHTKKYERIESDVYNKNKEMYNHHLDNKLWAYDKRIKSWGFVDKEEYCKNKEYYNRKSSNNVVVKDKNDKISFISKQEYENNKSEFTSVNSGTMTVIHKNGEFIKIKACEYDKNQYKLCSSDSVYVFDVDGNKISVSKKEFKENRKKYKLVNSLDEVIEVYSYEDLEKKRIPINEYDNDKHITKRCEIIKMYKDGVLVDAGICKSITYKYKHKLPISSTSIVNSYKKNQPFYVDGFKIECVKEKLSYNNLLLIKGFKTKQELCKSYIVILDNHDNQFLKIEEQDLNTIIKKHNLPRNLVFKSIKENGYKFYSNEKNPEKKAKRYGFEDYIGWSVIRHIEWNH